MSVNKVFVNISSSFMFINIFVLYEKNKTVWKKCWSLFSVVKGKIHKIKSLQPDVGHSVFICLFFNKRMKAMRCCIESSRSFSWSFLFQQQLQTCRSVFWSRHCLSSTFSSLILTLTTCLLQYVSFFLTHRINRCIDNRDVCIPQTPQDVLSNEM